MKSIIKFLFRNIAEKKFRSFLVILSISVAAALFYASGAVSDSLQVIYTERLTQMAGTSDLVIQPKDDPAVSQFIDVSAMAAVNGKTQYAIGILHSSALYSPSPDNTTYMNIIGTDLDELQQMNPPSFYKALQGKAFEGNEIIIGKGTSESLGIKAGSSIRLEIAGKADDFTVAGICNPKGLFLSESQGINIVMPKATVSRLTGADGKVNSIYIRLKDSSEKQDMIKKLGSIYKDCTVQESVDRDLLSQAISSITTPMTLVSVFVILMSAFIIFTSFKVISLERLPVIGTFRSVGATRKSTRLIMAFESVLFGVIGGITGCLLGIGASYLITLVTRPEWATGFDAGISINLPQLGAAFVFAVILSLVSSLIPSAAISKIPVKDIILNTRQKTAKRRGVTLVAGVVLLAVSLIVPVFVPNSVMVVLVADGICMVLALVALIMLIPAVTNIISKVLEKLLTPVLGNEAGLAARNVRDNKNLHNNIRLLTLGIATLLMIYTLNYSIGKGLADYYKNNTMYDISMIYRQADNSFVKRLLNTDGITEVTAAYELYSVKIKDKGQSFGVVSGVNPDNYLDFMKFGFDGDNRKKFDELDSGENIMLSYIMKDRLNVQEGDTITLALENGSHTFKVTGFVDSTRNNGSMALVSGKSLSSATGINFYNSIYIKTDKDPDAVLKSLKRSYLGNILYIRTNAQMQEDNEKGVEKIFSVLGSYSQLAMLIGIIGIINNLLVSFIERKRTFAIYRSSGMSKRKLLKMIVAESAICGVLGGIFGLLGTVSMLKIIPAMMKTMIGTIPMVLSSDLTIFYLIAGLVIMLAASVIPALKSSKLSIIETIKYE